MGHRHHIVKFGFETRWVLLNQGTSQSGTLTYNSTAALLANSMGSASYTAILPLVRQRKTQYFAYVRDEWKIAPEPDSDVRPAVQLLQCPPRAPR